MSRNTIKPRPVHQFLAASAVFLAIGGSAIAQTQAPAPALPGVPQAAASAAQAGPAHKGHRADGHHHRHHRHHGHHGGMSLRAADTDRDGAISKAEADAMFARVDANKEIGRAHV